MILVLLQPATVVRLGASCMKLGCFLWYLLMDFFPINLSSCALNSYQFIASVAFSIREFHSSSTPQGKKHSCFQLVPFHFVC